VTATDVNLKAIAGWMSERGIKRTALLAYNPLWISKAKGLGKSLEYAVEGWMSREERDRVREIFRAFELEQDL
jgi:pyruvate formate lyase activating enzyme